MADTLTWEDQPHTLQNKEMIELGRYKHGATPVGKDCVMVYCGISHYHYQTDVFGIYTHPLVNRRDYPGVDVETGYTIFGSPGNSVGRNYPPDNKVWPARFAYEKYEKQMLREWKTEFDEKQDLLARKAREQQNNPQ